MEARDTFYSYCGKETSTNIDCAHRKLEPKDNDAPACKHNDTHTELCTTPKRHRKSPDHNNKLSRWLDGTGPKTFSTAVALSRVVLGSGLSATHARETQEEGSVSASDMWSGVGGHEH